LKDIRTLSVSGIVLLIVFFGLSSSVNAAIRQFMPRIFDYSGELEIDTIYNKEENKSDGRGLTKKDFFARERFNLYLTGYSYHPRFIWYSLKLTTGLKEQNYKTGAFDTGWTTGSSWGYDFRAFVLPEHPYNLEIFFRRYEPLTRNAFAPQSSSVVYTKGATFRYKRKPYFLDLSYVDTTTESSGVEYDTISYRGSGTYYKEYIGGKLLSFSGSYDRRETSSSFSSFKSTSNDYTLGNNFSLKHLHLNGFFLENVALSSTVRYSTLEQGGGEASINDDIFTWSEGLRASLPWNFETGLTYSYSKSQTEFTLQPASKMDISTTSNIFSWDVSHRFYASIYTKYSFRKLKQDSPTGDSTMTSNALSINYSKIIPWGRLMAGAAFSKSVSENKGKALSIRDPHNGVEVPGFFTISDVREVEVSSITLFVRDPEPPNAFIPLTENVHFIVIEMGEDIRIDIISLPPQLSFPGTYDFIVLYSQGFSQTSRSVELETETRSYDISATLFEDMILPYYSHFSSTQRELSGSLMGEPLELESDTVGVSVAVRPFRLLLEYSDVRSNITPYRSWRSELRYDKDISLTTRLRTKARYSSVYYPMGTSRGVGSYTDNIFGLDAGVLKRFPKRNIALSLNGSYSQKDGLSESKVYAVNTFLSWKTRKLILTAGATLSDATSEFDGMRTERLSQYYFLKVKRELF
jgi:hypothetical protein